LADFKAGRGKVPASRSKGLCRDAKHRVPREVMTLFIEQGSVVVGTVRSAGSITALEHPLALSQSVAGFREKIP
jgi:hypothetical protein